MTDATPETVTIEVARLRHLERHYELAQSAIGLFKLGGGLTPAVRTFLNELGQEGDDRLRAVGAGVFARRPARESIPRPYTAVDGGFDQRQWDFDAMTKIAAFLRDNPADPFSGRQCEELVLDARDRLYAPDYYFLLKQAILDLVRIDHVWKDPAVEPPCAEGEQADVLFTTEGDFGVYVGMVTHFKGAKDEPQHLEWSTYDQDNDSFAAWDGDPPTLYMIKPKSPQSAGMVAVQAAGLQL